MRARTIINAVDALRTQNRLILHLECGHNASVWAVQLVAERILDPRADEKFKRGAEFNCPVCPDPPPPTVAEVRQSKSAYQLWKEAGRP